jgi:hypothetical protein
MQQQVVQRVLAGEGVSAGAAGQIEGGNSSRIVMECTIWMDRNTQQMVMAARQQQQGVVQGMADAVTAVVAGVVAA